MSQSADFGQAFRPAFLTNTLTALVHRFYAAWEDLRAPADRVLALLHPAGFQMELSLLGTIETEDALREAWTGVSGELAQAAHHVQSIELTPGTGGEQVARVHLIGQLVDHQGGMKVLDLESELRCAVDRHGDWRIRHYKVKETGAAC